MKYLSLIKGCCYVALLALFVLGCSEGIIGNEVEVGDSTLAQSYSIDTFSLDTQSFEMVDGVDVLLSISLVHAYCSNFYGRIKYPTLDGGVCIKRPFGDEIYRIQFAGTGIYDGRDKIVEKLLAVYPVDKVCVSTDDSVSTTIDMHITIDGGPFVWDGEDFIYMRYNLYYLDNTYRYAKFKNSEDDPQHYTGVIRLPINLDTVSGYITIDNLRITNGYGDWGS